VIFNFQVTSTSNSGKGIRFSNGSSEVVRITGGNVGIGTTSPASGYKLDVNGVIGANTFTGNSTGTTLFTSSSGHAVLRSNGGNAYIDATGSNNIVFRTTNASTNRMYIANDGDVGIGTINPAYKLDVAGDIQFSGNLYKNGLSFNPGSQWTTTGSNIYYNTGYVGIGTTDPEYELDVGGDINSFGDGTANVRLGSFQSVAYLWCDDGTTALRFGLPGGEKMRITNDGNVGIGTTSPDKHLHITGGQIQLGNSSLFGGAFRPGIYMYQSYSGTNGNAKIYQDVNNTLVVNVNGNDKMYIRPDADLLINNFTGQHRTFVKDIPAEQSVDYKGLIVCANNNSYLSMSHKVCKGNEAITQNESLPILSLSTKSKDKSCFGVISDGEDPESRYDSVGSAEFLVEKELGDTRIYINSLGEGAIWVSDICGNLESGDYITTSDIPGYGQVQESEFLANYTVAKITMDCDFSPVLQYKQAIKKKDQTDSSGNFVYDGSGSIFVDESGNIIEYENGPVQYEASGNIYYEKEEIQDQDLSGNQEIYTKIYERINNVIVDNSNNEVYNFNHSIRQINDLDGHNKIQWVDTEEQEYAYNIRYIDLSGTILTQEQYNDKKASNEPVYKAAYVGCTYHCG